MSVTLSGYAISAPGSAPTGASGSSSGSLGIDTGTYKYKVTYVSVFGETDPSPASATITTTTGTVSLSAIPVSSSPYVIARRLYRTIEGASGAYKTLATISDNVTTTYIDSIADGSLGADAATINSAHSMQTVAGLVAFGKPLIHSYENGITAGASGTSAAAYQLSAEYSTVTTVATINDSVRLPEISAALVGMRAVVRNIHANTCKIYPFTGQSINGTAADTAVTLATVTGAEFLATSATNWTQFR